jgi:hypothetical protein
MTRSWYAKLWLVAAAGLALPVAARAQGNPAPTVACSAPFVRRDSVPDLAGLWDFRIDMGTSVATGTMALGHMDDGYAGALTPDATNTVAIRKLLVHGDSVHMRVASREGDVLFDGRLQGAGNALCGIVTYHGGKLFPMTATQRPGVRRP